MSAERNAQPYYNQDYDLENCDQEPLKFIRRLQPFASLVVTDAYFKKWHFATEDLLETLSKDGIAGLFPDQDITLIEALQDGDSIEINTNLGLKRITKHFLNQLFYLEFEEMEASELSMDKYQSSILKIAEADFVDDFLEIVLNEVHEMTGYDHLMIYRFDEDYNGEVIREKLADGKTSYLGLRFPASDIPEQARALYHTETIRTIADVAGEQVPIFKNPKSELEDHLNLTNIHSRGVSPIHLEYLSNIHVHASFSVALIKDGMLWGLIACHHSAPKLISYQTRNWLKFLARLISINLDKIVTEQSENARLKQQISKNKILTSISDSNDLQETLSKSSNELLELVAAKSFIVKSGDSIIVEGDHIDSNRVGGIFEWLQEKESFDLIHTSKSKNLLPKHLYDPAIAGLLIIQLSHASQDYVIFVRPEEQREVLWAGDPNHTKVFSEEKGRLTPRKSFEKWKGIIKEQSKPWTRIEKEIATQIKSEIREYLYLKYDEMKLLNKELRIAYDNMESFSYTVSHDLKAPLRSIEGFAQILLEDYSEKLDDDGIQILRMISENITKMNHFIRDILNYSKINNNELSICELDISNIAYDVWETLVFSASQAELIIPKEFPTVFGDVSQIKMVFSNLFSNSLKYVEPGVKPVIKITYEVKEGFVNFALEDNGIGIPKGKEKSIFEMFRRMVSDKNYDGTGIGLSIVKKIIEKHSGEIQAISDFQGGAKFVFSLPSNIEYLDFVKKTKAK